MSHQLRAERLLVRGPVGNLEALIETPPAVSGHHFALVCHPHPLFGGTLDNKVVHTLARAFQDCGAATIRFNFRGVGSSGGEYAEGVGETDDALALIEHGRSRWPGAALWLAGFSFGGAVAIRAAADSSPALLVAAAPAVVRLERLELDVSGTRTRSCPWLIVQGDADEVLPAPSVLDWASKVVPAPAVSVFKGGSHFFHGRLHELRETVAGFVRGASANQ